MELESQLGKGGEREGEKEGGRKGGREVSEKGESQRKMGKMMEG